MNDFLFLVGRCVCREFICYTHVAVHQETIKWSDISAWTPFIPRDLRHRESESYLFLSLALPFIFFEELHHLFLTAFVVVVFVIILSLPCTNITWLDLKG